jgi:nicotinamidase-related amidase
MECAPGASVWEGSLAILPDIEIVPQKTALLIVDMQYLDAHPDYGMGRRGKETGTADKFAFYFQSVREMIPRIQELQQVCRARGIEVIFLVIASLVNDCRDVSLEHKRLDLLAPADSKEAQILDEIAPLPNELVITKGCSGVFNGTAIDQILRNMGIDTLIVCGVATNYCVETAVRDAGDRGYNVILLRDACAAVTPEDQAFAMRILDNVYCKVMTTQEVIDRIPSTAEASKAGVAGS